MFNQSANKVLCTALLAFACVVTMHTVAEDSAHSVSVPVARLKFQETGVGPLKAAAGYGEMSRGPHGTFIKLPASYATPFHHHSGDYYGVVIEGVVANEQQVTGKDQPLAPGSYWFQKGGEDHVTKCLSKVDCVIFISQADKFDFVPAK